MVILPAIFFMNNNKITFYSVSKSPSIWQAAVKRGNAIWCLQWERKLRDNCIPLYFNTHRLGLWDARCLGQTPESSEFVIVCKRKWNTMKLWILNIHYHLQNRSSKLNRLTDGRNTKLNPKLSKIFLFVNWQRVPLGFYFLLW